jgi:hypothetical protein
MQRAEEPAEVGFVSIRDSHFVAPAGTKSLDLPNGNFKEIVKDRPTHWQLSGSSVRTVPGAGPEGIVSIQADSNSPFTLSMGNVPFVGDVPYLISFWLKSTSGSSFEVGVSSNDSAAIYGRHTVRKLPEVRAKWRRVGIFVRMASGTTSGSLWFRRAPDDVSKGQILHLADVRIRTATEDEMDRAYWGWRAKYPPRDLSPRSMDGTRLALSIRKLTEGFSPDRPFLIWGIGPSYLNMLGDGTTLTYELRRRFPGAPRIIYKKHVGSSVPWQYVLGWARHVVTPEQPDLVLLYGIGAEEDLENIFRTLRQHTTADIIVASVHWKADDVRHWGVDEDATNFGNIPKMRELCARYGVEFVENRKEWAAYLRQQGMKIEVDPQHGLLRDAVHQSDYGALVINENIARHFARPAAFAYEASQRERRLPAVSAGHDAAGHERLLPQGSGWQRQGAVLRSSRKGDRLAVHFTGNRIDLVGIRSETGGAATIIIDGKPADTIPCFYTTYMLCGAKNARPKSGSVMDSGPHGVSLGTHVIPQEWTVRMLDDAGNYELNGSVTGPDGRGNAVKPFTSKSGQLIIPPELWRHGAGCVPFLHPWDGHIVNKAGDTFAFSVYRCSVGSVSFRGADENRFRVSLARNLPNSGHILELVASGDGDICIEAFEIYEPPLK